MVDACQEMNIHVCLDISHSKLVCNTYDVDFQNFLPKSHRSQNISMLVMLEAEMEKDFKSAMVRLILKRRENF